MATVDELLALDIRVGTIVSARVVRGARKPTYALTIDFGSMGTRGAGAEIADLYEVDDLVGLQVVAVVNLPAERVAGFDSEVMILTAKDATGQRILVIPGRPVADGAKVD